MISTLASPLARETTIDQSAFGVSRVARRANLAPDPKRHSRPSPTPGRFFSDRIGLLLAALDGALSGKLQPCETWPSLRACARSARAYLRAGRRESGLG